MLSANATHILFDNLRRFLLLTVLVIFPVSGCSHSQEKLPQEVSDENPAGAAETEETPDKIDYFAENPVSEREAEALRVLRSGGARISRDVVEDKVYTLVHLHGTWKGETSKLEHIEQLYSVGEISFPSGTTSEQFEILSGLDINLLSILVKSAELSDTQTEILRKKHPRASIFDGSEYLINAAK